MKTIKGATFYIAAALVFAILKFFYLHTDSSALTFLLLPTNFLVELFTNSQSIFIADTGYYHESTGIMIDRSCSGYNFWILCFLMLSFLSFKYFRNTYYKILIIPASLFSAYVITILANASRIIASVIVQDSAGSLSLTEHSPLIHEATGVATYLTFLILAYLTTSYLLTLKKKNENFA